MTSITNCSEELMEIDRNTFLALDIFAPTRRQEAGYRSILAGEVKKNATLFGLVNRCKSTPGRAMLRYDFVKNSWAFKFKIDQS